MKYTVLDISEYHCGTIKVLGTLTDEDLQQIPTYPGAIENDEQLIWLDEDGGTIAVPHSAMEGQELKSYTDQFLGEKTYSADVSINIASTIDVRANNPEEAIQKALDRAEATTTLPSPSIDVDILEVRDEDDNIVWEG